MARERIYSDETLIECVIANQPIHPSERTLVQRLGSICEKAIRSGNLAIVKLFASDADTRRHLASPSKNPVPSTGFLSIGTVALRDMLSDPTINDEVKKEVFLSTLHTIKLASEENSYNRPALLSIFMQWPLQHAAQANDLNDRLYETLFIWILEEWMYKAHNGVADDRVLAEALLNYAPNFFRHCTLETRTRIALRNKRYWQSVPRAFITNLIQIMGTEAGIQLEQKMAAPPMVAVNEGEHEIAESWLQQYWPQEQTKDLLAVIILRAQHRRTRPEWAQDIITWVRAAEHYLTPAEWEQLKEDVLRHVQHDCEANVRVSTDRIQILMALVNAAGYRTFEKALIPVLLEGSTHPGDYLPYLNKEEHECFSMHALGGVATQGHLVKNLFYHVRDNLFANPASQVQFLNHEHTKAFVNLLLYKDLYLFQIATKFSQIEHAKIIMPWLLRLNQVIRENEEAAEADVQREFFLIMQAIICNRDQQILAYLGSLIENNPKLDISALPLPRNIIEYVKVSFDNPTELTNIAHSLSPKAKADFNRFIARCAIHSGRFDILIKLCTTHSLLENASLQSMILEIDQIEAKHDDRDRVNDGMDPMDRAVQGTVDGKRLMQVFLLFKLRQSALKEAYPNPRIWNPQALAEYRTQLENLQTKLRKVLQVAIDKIHPQLTIHLSTEHKELILTLFEIGKEGRYINNQGQVEGEPVIQGKTFLQWAAEDIQDQAFIESLFLAGASTQGLEQHPHVQKLIATYNSFDKPDAPQRNAEGTVLPTTVVGALLQITPCARLIATYAQPTLPAQNFGSQTAPIQACRNQLSQYCRTVREHIAAEEALDRSKVVSNFQGRIELEDRAFARAKATQALDALAPIRQASTPWELIHTTEHYLQEWDESINPQLHHILEDLQKCTAHLKYGEQSSTADEDGAPQPKR